MRHRPTLLKILSLGILAVPVVCFAILDSFDPHFFQHLGKDLKIEFVALAMASLVAAFGVWRARPWGFKLFITYVAIIVIADIADFLIHPQSRNMWHYADMVTAVIGLAIIFRRANRDLFYNKALRWWERATRMAVNIDARFINGNADLRGQIISLSESGCLSTLKDVMDTGKIVTIEFLVNDEPVKLDARVVRLNQKPLGIAFEFAHPSFISRVKFGFILRSHRHVLIKSAA